MPKRSLHFLNFLILLRGFHTLSPLHLGILQLLVVLHARGQTSLAVLLSSSTFLQRPFTFFLLDCAQAQLDFVLPSTCHVVLSVQNDTVGLDVGVLDGFFVGFFVDGEVGLTVGVVVGLEVGFDVGSAVIGRVVGVLDGFFVGFFVDGEVGLTVGVVVGLEVGFDVGSAVIGRAVGLLVVVGFGLDVGCGVGCAS